MKMTIAICGCAALIIALVVFVVFRQPDGNQPAAQPQPEEIKFNSKLALRIWTLDATSEPDYLSPKDVGTTPANAEWSPVRIPAEMTWGITPDGDTTFAAAVAEMRSRSIPGLALYCDAMNVDLMLLKDLPRLQTLIFIGTPFAGEGLAVLKDLKGLQTLGLAGIEITDAGLVHIKDLQGLWRLDLSGTQITDAGLGNLEDLRGLRTLYLGWNRIADTGLAHLKNLRELRTLNLAKTQVTDAGLAHLKDMKELQELDLEATQITDAGLPHLMSLKGLLRLSLAGTKVTDAGVAELQRTLPRAGISK